MNSDESFEREVRATLEGLASEPAPERLVARVAAVPTEEPVPQALDRRLRPPSHGVASGFAAIAAVLALAVAAIVLRPAAAPGPGSSETLPPTIAPSVPPTAAPATSPAVQPSATPPAVAGVPVPAGFRPMSVTFISADQGWVLGSATCATGRCPAIARTLDSGRTWTSIPAPATKIGTQPSVDVSGAGVTGLRFADALDGWAFGPELWATHDGGTTWKRLDPLPGGSVLALASARGIVHAVAYDGESGYRIASAPIDGDGWTVSSLNVPVGAGPVPVIQLVLSGDAGWVLENDRVVTAGARLVGGTWRTWQPVCADVVGPAFLAASSPTEVVAACDVGAWSTPQGVHLYVSRDGGTTFAEKGSVAPIGLSLLGAIAAPTPSSIVLAGADLVGSFDGGRTWQVVARPGAVSYNDLGFTTPTQGVVITTSEGGASKLYMTRDGGHTWSAVAF